MKSKVLVGIQFLLSVIALALIIMAIMVILPQRIIAQNNIELSKYVYISTISWSDNVMNSDNDEFVEEVRFQYFGDIALDKLCREDMQFMFVYRYYESCTQDTQAWFNYIISNHALVQGGTYIAKEITQME